MQEGDVIEGSTFQGNFGNGIQLFSSKTDNGAGPITAAQLSRFRTLCLAYSADLRGPRDVGDAMFYANLRDKLQRCFRPARIQAWQRDSSQNDAWNKTEKYQADIQIAAGAKPGDVEQAKKDVSEYEAQVIQISSERATVPPIVYHSCRLRAEPVVNRFVGKGTVSLETWQASGGEVVQEVTWDDGRVKNATKAELVLMCFKCGDSDGVSMCSRCRVAVYCSANCQAQDWKRHKKVCKPSAPAAAAAAAAAADAAGQGEGQGQG